MKKRPIMICDEFQPKAEAILVRANHAAPLPTGTRVWAGPEGTHAGAISMGCVDLDVVERLQALIRERGSAEVAHYAQDNELTGEVGLTCGGRIDILLRLIPDGDPVYAALSALDADEEYTLLTNLDGAHAGCQRLYRVGQPPAGSLGETVLDESADKALDTQGFAPGTRTHEFEGISCLVERHEPSPRLLLVGASSIAVQLCPFAARAGYAVYLVDPRRELAKADRFPDAISILHKWPEEAFEQLAVDSSWYVAVLAHDLKLDTPALAEALRRACRYIGLLGSGKTQQKHRERLQQEGFSKADLDKVRGPIGLEIDAVTPEEIAVSILAELIRTRREGLEDSTIPALQ